MAALSRGVGDLAALAKRVDADLRRSSSHRHQSSQSSQRQGRQGRQGARRGPCEESVAELVQLMLALDAVARGELGGGGRGSINANVNANANANAEAEAEADGGSGGGGTESDSSSISSSSSSLPSSHRRRHRRRPPPLLDEQQRRVKGYPDLRPFSFIAVLDKAVDDNLGAELLWSSVDLGGGERGAAASSTASAASASASAGIEGEAFERRLRSSGVLTRAAAQDVSTRLKSELGLL